MISKNNFVKSSGGSFKGHLNPAGGQNKVLNFK